MIDRRKMISLGASLSLTPLLLKGESTKHLIKEDLKSGAIPNELTILFQGDSITDAGRSRSHYYANQTQGMGLGYVNLAASQLLHDHPDKKLNIYNRGIGGHKVFQLSNRWEEDCLQLTPHVLSIMIGVNDFWHTLTHDYEGTVETYQDDLRSLLNRTAAAIPDIKIIIGEPFAVKGGTAVKDFFDGTFDRYRQASASIAQEFGAAFIPFHKLFAEAAQQGGATHWCPDGVHPSMAGSALMKEAWLKAFHSLYA